MMWALGVWSMQPRKILLLHPWAVHWGWHANSPLASWPKGICRDRGRQLSCMQTGVGNRFIWRNLYSLSRTFTSVYLIVLRRSAGRVTMSPRWSHLFITSLSFLAQCLNIHHHTLLQIKLHNQIILVWGKYVS